jgi:hypothetical protein
MPDGGKETKGHPAMSERDCLLSIFNAICGLAERLTGERIVVTVDLESGGRVQCFGDGVSWEKASAAAASSLSDPPQESASMPAEAA